MKIIFMLIIFTCLGFAQGALRNLNFVVDTLTVKPDTTVQISKATININSVTIVNESSDSVYIACMATKTTDKAFRIYANTSKEIFISDIKKIYLISQTKAVKIKYYYFK